MTNQSNLKSLIEGCRQQDRIAQRQLFQMFYKLAMSVAMRYTASMEEAREITNDAFFRLFSKMESYNEEMPFQSWLTRVVVFTSIDYYRKYNRHKVPLTPLDTAVFAETDDNPLEHLSAEELLALVQQLPPAYRLAINLYAIEGYSHQEIASMLGISEGASKSNLFKARAKFREMIQANKLKRTGL